MPDDTALPETWRPVVGYEDAYEVSDLGRVRSLDREVRSVGKNGHSWTQSLAGRVLKPSVTSDGYMQVGLGREYHPLIHKLVMEAFVGPAPDGTECCHGNGVSWDNRLANLRWDTKSANSQDSVRHGSHSRTRRSHCPRGHILALPNLRVAAWRDRGKRECLACSRAHTQRRNERLQGRAMPDLKTLADSFYAQIMADAAA